MGEIALSDYRLQVPFVPFIQENFLQESMSASEIKDCCPYWLLEHSCTIC